MSTQAPGRHRRTSERDDRPSTRPAFELSEAKLRAPAARPGIVARTALVDRLAATHAPTLISVVAPPGYGKMTVLSQWAERRLPRVGWVSADDRDNDPAVLLTAIEHAQAAGDADHVSRITLNVANAVWASGRADTVLRWMKWFDDRGLVGSYPGIAVHGALMFALMGQPGETDRWAVAAERAPSGGTLDDGNTVEATFAYLRALLGRDGVETMRRDAQIALVGLSPASPYRATMLYTEAVSWLLDGDLDRAEAIAVQALDAATAGRVLPFVPVVLATRGIIAIELDDWDEAAAFADRAAAVMQEGNFDDYWTSALVYALMARVALHLGDVAAGRDYVARAARVRRLLSYALPVVSVQALLEMARAYVALADPAGGRAVLRQVNDILRQRPQLGILPRQAEELRGMLDAIRGGAPGASSLTTAELRLLPMLQTHLTFREIGERLYVSRHTVKTQAISVYRKLGVSSRSEAITRMHELGLLAHA